MSTGNQRRNCSESGAGTDERSGGPCGHAYSGAVIGAVKEDWVKTLVYIAALAPDEGESVAKGFYRDPKPPESPKLAPDSHGFIWIPDGGFRQAVAHKASAEQTSIATAVQRPIAVEEHRDLFIRRVPKQVTAGRM
jgi:hypothetical protein